MKSIERDTTKQYDAIWERIYGLVDTVVDERLPTTASIGGAFIYHARIKQFNDRTLFGYRQYGDNVIDTTLSFSKQDELIMDVRLSNEHYILSPKTIKYEAQLYEHEAYPRIFYLWEKAPNTSTGYMKEYRYYASSTESITIYPAGDMMRVYVGEKSHRRSISPVMRSIETLPQDPTISWHIDFFTATEKILEWSQLETFTSTIARSRDRIIPAVTPRIAA